MLGMSILEFWRKNIVLLVSNALLMSNCRKFVILKWPFPSYAACELPRDQMHRLNSFILSPGFYSNKGNVINTQKSCIISYDNGFYASAIIVKNKEKNVHRYAVRGKESLTFKREMLCKLRYSVRDPNYGILLGIHYTKHIPQVPYLTSLQWCFIWTQILIIACKDTKTGLET